MWTVPTHSSHPRPQAAGEAEAIIRRAEATAQEIKEVAAAMARSRGADAVNLKGESVAVVGVAGHIYCCWEFFFVVGVFSFFLYIFFFFCRVGRRGGSGTFATSHNVLNWV